MKKASIELLKDNRLVRQPGWLSHSLAVFQAFSLTKLRFLMEVVRKLKFPNNSNIRNLCVSLDWLEYSHEQCVIIGIKDGYTKDEFDKFENLTSRYARTCDLLVNKVLRGIDAVEFDAPGTIIDSVNRAEKRGLIESVDELRGLKDLRNEIAHEYETAGLDDLFSYVLEAVPRLSKIISRVTDYCKKYTGE